MRRRSFKQILHDDVKNVFLNPLEFGEEHEVNGKTVIVVFDDIENVEREKQMKSHMDGVYSRQKFLYIATEDFGELPPQQSLVTVDGIRYEVMDATDEAGIYAITLEAATSYGKRKPFYS